MANDGTTGEKDPGDELCFETNSKNDNIDMGCYFYSTFFDFFLRFYLSLQKINRGLNIDNSLGYRW